MPRGGVEDVIDVRRHLLEGEVGLAGGLAQIFDRRDVPLGVSDRLARPREPAVGVVGHELGGMTAVHPYERGDDVHEQVVIGVVVLVHDAAVEQDELFRVGRHEDVPRVQVAVDVVVGEDHGRDRPAGHLAQPRFEVLVVGVVAAELLERNAVAERLDEHVRVGFVGADGLGKEDLVAVFELLVEASEVLGLVPEIELRAEHPREFLHHPREVVPAELLPVAVREPFEKVREAPQDANVVLDALPDSGVHDLHGHLLLRPVVRIYFPLVHLGNAPAPQHLIMLYSKVLPPVLPVGLSQDPLRVIPRVRRRPVLQRFEGIAERRPENVGTGRGPLGHLDDDGAAPLALPHAKFEPSIVRLLAPTGAGILQRGGRRQHDYPPDAHRRAGGAAEPLPPPFRARGP
mmetsp:Transcript_6419/g.18838  ORF Transcript_6419/g.18838 Transcript_6419/m.18838 type:complete len:402 (+) Transcript_6419:1033-2238(+)